MTMWRGGLQVLIFCACVFALEAKNRFPPYLTLCSRNEVDMNACVRNAVEQLKPHLGKGVPEMLIPPMDPLYLPRIELNTGQGFNLTFIDTYMNHTDKFVVDNVDVDLDKGHLKLQLTFPVLNGSCSYDVSGRILILNLQGHGPAWVNISDAHANLSVKFSRFHRDNKEFLKVDDIKLWMELGKPSFWFEGLFSDAQLTAQTNKAVNDNVSEILEDLSNVIEEAIIQFCIGLVKRVLGKYSYDELFPK